MSVTCVLDGCHGRRSGNYVACYYHLSRLPEALSREFLWHNRYSYPTTARRDEAVEDALTYLLLPNQAARDEFIKCRATEKRPAPWACAEMNRTRTEEWRDIEFARFQQEQNAVCDGRR